jgi:hypothetical protein
MKITINESQFLEAFKAAGRDKQFSYKGLKILFAAFEEMENATGQEIELDVIGICCEYIESAWEDIADNYSIDMPANDDEGCETVRQYLEHYTQIVGEPSDGIFVYQQF